MMHTETEKIKNNVYDLTVVVIYGELEAAGLMEDLYKSPQLRDAIVSAMLMVADHFSAPEFGIDPEEG